LRDGAAKALVKNWIDGLEEAGVSLSDELRQELLDQVAKAIPHLDSEGGLHFEVPALSSMGRGIFQHSFRMGPVAVTVTPYWTQGACAGAAADSGVPGTQPGGGKP
jgi:hypothetical protein